MTDDAARRNWLRDAQAEDYARRAAAEADVAPARRWGETERVFIPREVACALALMGRGK